MITTYYQIEFYSEQDRRWVPLFAKFPTSEAALEQSKDIPPPRRITRVTQTTELIEESRV